MDLIGQIESHISQKCVGYQKNHDGTTNTVIEGQVRLKDGRIATCWIVDGQGIVALPSTTKPHIDIPDGG